MNKTKTTKRYVDDNLLGGRRSFPFLHWTANRIFQYENFYLCELRKRPAAHRRDASALSGAEGDFI